MKTTAKTKKGEIAMAVLKGIGVAGVLLAGIALPNLVSILPGHYKKRYSRKALDQSIANLKKKGLIMFSQGNNGWRLELTEKGHTEFYAYETKQKLFKPAKKWSGDWHLLVFDIPEERKNVRHQVRRTLESLGFYRLQDSVWVFPYECEEVLELLRTKYHVRYEALYIQAKKIAKDEWLRKHFNLPLE